MRRWLFLVGSCLSFAVGCGGSGGSTNPDAPSADGGPKADGGGGTPDAPRPDANVTPDARITPDAAPQADAGPQIDGGGACTSDPECSGAGTACNASGQQVTCEAVAGFPTCFHATNATTCQGVQTCQGAAGCACPAAPAGCTTADQSVCGPGGGTATCVADAQGCFTLSAETACANNGPDFPEQTLVCVAGSCVCPTADQGAVEGGPCDTVGAQVCESTHPNANNLLVCGSVAIGSQSCQIWNTLGGAAGDGNCRAEGVTCDATAHQCKCPDHAGTVWFANPVADRTLFHQHAIEETGIQSPAACAFETATVALLNAQNQIDVSHVAAATVVLAGGTSPLTPATFTGETFPLEVGDKLRITVDTEQNVAGIVPPAGVTPDPRNNIVFFNTDGGGPALHLTGTGSAHGFTIAGAGCGGLSSFCSTGEVALSADGNTGGADGMFLEGGGGPILDASNSTVTATIADNGDGTATLTYAQSDVFMRNGVVGFGRFILINDPATLDADGVFRIVDITLPDADHIAITYFTGSAPTSTSAVHWTVNGQGALSTGLEITNGTQAAFTNLVAENFWVSPGIEAKVKPLAQLGTPNDGVGVSVRSTDDTAGVSFTGLFLFDNATGFISDADVEAATVVTINDGPLGGVLLLNVPNPTIAASFFTGLEVDSGSLTASGLVVTGTQDDFGVFADGGTLTLNGGHIDGNLNGGMEIDGADHVLATNTSFSGNQGTGVDVSDIEDTNATFVGTHMDNNTGTGLTNEGNTVFVTNGATINGNNLLGVSSSGDLTVDGSAGTVNISNNFRIGVAETGNGTLTLISAEIDGNSATSNLGLCDDTHRQQYPAVDIEGNAVLHATGTNVANNHGAGLRFNSNGAASTITGGSVTGNSAAGGDLAPANCGEFDGIEMFSLLTLAGGVQVNGNGGNGVEVHAATLTVTGATFSANALDGVRVDATAHADLGAQTISGNCATPALADGSDSSPLAGLASFGSVAATGTTVSGNLCDGVLIDQNGPVQSVLKAVAATTNQGDGIHVLNASAVDDVSDISEDPVADTTMGVQIIGGSNASSNTANGIHIGDADAQAGSIYALIADSNANANGGSGILASGTASNPTFVSVVSNRILANVGPGLSDAGAHLRDATVSGTLNPAFSKNDLEANGYATQNQCTAGESAAQILFTGALAQLDADHLCTSLNGMGTGTCEAGTPGTPLHCIYNATTNQCFYAYWLQGGTTDSCDASNTNRIKGYLADGSSEFTVGVSAKGGAAVNASGNTWKNSSPSLGIDIFNDAASFVKRVGSCQAGPSTCNQP